MGRVSIASSTRHSLDLSQAVRRGVSTTSVSVHRPPWNLDGAGDRWHQAVRSAQRGSAATRDELLRTFLPFVVRIARRTCRRRLDLGHDDEVSVALIAFNEAIDRYRPWRGKSFVGFAEMVVRHRVIDCLRRESARRETPVSCLVQPTADGMEDPALRCAEFRQAMAAYRSALEAVEGREAVRAYLRLLRRYGIDPADLMRNCPRRADARERAIAAARAVVDDPDWCAFVRRRRSLPLKEMAAAGRLGVSRKTLERHRTYIVAMVLLFLSRDGSAPGE